MSLYDEVAQAGEFGPRSYVLLLKLMSEELRRFPALGGDRLREVDDFVHQFFVDRGNGLTAGVLVEAFDDDSFGKYVRRSVRNWLIDQVRQTDVGALRRQVEDLMANHPGVEMVPSGVPGAGRWRVRGSAVGPWAGDPSELDEVAAGVAVRAVRSRGTERRPPLGSRSELEALATVILERAAGSLETAQLVDVFTRRFPGALDPITTSLDDVRERSGVLEIADVSERSDPEAEVLAEEAQSAASRAAGIIYDQLDGWERLIVPLLTDVGSVQTILKCGRSVAYLRIKRVQQRISELSDPAVDAHALFDELVKRCGAP